MAGLSEIRIRKLTLEDLMTSSSSSSDGIVRILGMGSKFGLQQRSTCDVLEEDERESSFWVVPTVVRVCRT
jgi:hypothetical protein